MQSIAKEFDPLQVNSFSVRSMLLLAISATLFLVYSHISWRSDMYETAPALDQIMEVKVNLMSSHVLLEEMERGYLNVPLAEVKDSIKQAHRMTSSLLEGRAHIGHTQGTLPDDELLVSNLTSLQAATYKMLDSIGKEIDLTDESTMYHLHDLLFKQAMAYAEAADARMHDLIAEKLEQQQLIFIVAMTIWLSIMVFILWRWRQLSTRFSKSNDQLNKLSHAVEQTSESMLISDRHGVIEYVNAAFTKITGYENEEALGKNPSLLSSGQQDSRFYKKMWDTILAGKVWQGEVVDRRKDGSLYRADLSISPIRGEAGEVSHFVAIQRDISELRDVQESLIQAKKMDAIGTMCCGLAHDMNNTLSVVLGNIEMAQMDEQISNKVKKQLAQAESAVFLAASMIEDLLSYSSKSNLSFESLNLGKEVQNLLRLIQPMFGKVNLELKTDKEIDFILADKQQFQRILTNLIKNACDALEETESPSILMYIETVSPDELKIEQKEQNICERNWVRLSISDNGHGIRPDILEKVFDPFFTTKEVGKGTGLGLSSVYGMMQSHSGFIDVDSVVGQGTTFNLYFPCSNVSSD